MPLGGVGCLPGILHQNPTVGRQRVAKEAQCGWLRGICWAELLNFRGFGVPSAPAPSAFPVSSQESQRGAGDPAAGHEDLRGLHGVLVLDHHVSTGQNSGVSGISQFPPSKARAVTSLPSVPRVPGHTGRVVTRGGLPPAEASSSPWWPASSSSSCCASWPGSWSG